MPKTNKPVALVVMDDVPEDAISLLEAQGHLLYTPKQAVEAGVNIHAWVGGRCWRMPESFWLKDGELAPTAKVMLKAVQAQVYPPKPAKPKKGKRA